ncbi:hypothetical protein CK203_000136 [Vitis vinifera]|uniref:Conserved oligomeric Golgi complex subunit 1 n=1 Tax=Vitis vinifera TaxID=29760 RepID=A0A438KQ32_VITVI|nr:hypothetical protein CK203_000136 [Vitis vinifera]
MKFRCRFAPLEGAVAHCGPSKGWVLVGTVVQVSIPIIDQLGQGVPHSKPFLVVGDFKVIGIYGDFLSANDAGGSQVSEKGVLQVLLDLRFVADVLCGGDLNVSDDLSKSSKVKFPFRRKQDKKQTKSIIRERVDGLVNRFSQRMDPIDWLT